MAGIDSGVTDKDYNLITVLQLCLENVYRLEQYASDAKDGGDDELAELFSNMQEHSRKGADQCKQLLTGRLQG